MTTPSGYTPVSIDMKKVIGTGEAGTVKFYSFAPISLPSGDVVPPNPTAVGGATVVLASDGTGSVDLAPTDNPTGLGYGTRYIVKYTGVADTTERLIGSIQVTTSTAALALADLLTAGLNAAASSSPDPSKNWYTATTTALMQAMRSLNNGDRVFVDGKGVYRAEVPPITTASGNLALTSNDGNTRFVLDVDGSAYRQVFNAKAFGATGNGTTDDRAALQAAITAAAAAGGGTVFLPAGTYLITTALALTSVNNVAVVGVSGAGGASGTIVKVGANNTHAFTLAGAKGCVFKDLHVTRSSSFTGTGDGFNCTASTSDCRWLDCLVDYMDVGLYTDHSWQNYVRGCSFIHCKKGAYITVAGGSSNDTKFIGCAFFNSQTYGVHINANTVTVQACDFESAAADTATYDVFVQFGVDCLVAHNTTMYRGIDAPGATRLRVLGNGLFNSSGINQNGILIRDGSTGGTVSGNDVSAAVSRGIFIRNMEDVVVTGNTVRNSAGAGIDINNSTTCVVTGNRCFDDQGVKTQTYGVATTGTSDTNIITGNNCTGNLTGGFSLVGSANTVAANLPSTSDAYSASNLTGGTVPDARFPATLPAGSGVNLTALNASNLGSGTVPDARFPATLPAASGVNLTALNGSNITSGTVLAARLPADVVYNDVAPTFTVKVTTKASAAAGAGINVPPGAAPTSPADGDMWVTTAGGLFFQRNGATKTAADLETAQTASGAKTFSGGITISSGGLLLNGGTTQLNGTKFTQIGAGFMTSYNQDFVIKTNDNGTAFDVDCQTGNFKISAVGKGLLIKEGTNATMGTATLVAGAVTVSTTKVTASSRIQLTGNADGGTPGWLRVSTRTAGTSFTITSSSGADTGTVAWIILEPAP